MCWLVTIFSFVKLNHLLHIFVFVFWFISKYKQSKKFGIFLPSSHTKLVHTTDLVAIVKSEQEWQRRRIKKRRRSKPERKRGKNSAIQNKKIVYVKSAFAFTFAHIFGLVILWCVICFFFSYLKSSLMQMRLQCVNFLRKLMWIQCCCCCCQSFFLVILKPIPLHLKYIPLLLLLLQLHV